MILSFGAVSSGNAALAATMALDDARVYNRALSISEAFELFDASRKGHPNTLNWDNVIPFVAPAAAGVPIPVFMHQYRQRRIF